MTVNHASVLTKEYFISYLTLIMKSRVYSLPQAESFALDFFFKGDNERAFVQNKNIMLTIWEKANYLQWSGVIQAIDEENQELLLETMTNTKPIPLRQIYAARIEDDYND